MNGRLPQVAIDLVSPVNCWGINSIYTAALLLGMGEEVTASGCSRLHGAFTIAPKTSGIAEYFPFRMFNGALQESNMDRTGLYYRMFV